MQTGFRVWKTSEWKIWPSVVKGCIWLNLLLKVELLHTSQWNLVFKFYLPSNKTQTRNKTNPQLSPYLSAKHNCLSTIPEFTSTGKVSMIIHSHIWGWRVGGGWRFWQQKMETLTSRCHTWEVSLLHIVSSVSWPLCPSDGMFWQDFWEVHLISSVSPHPVCSGNYLFVKKSKQWDKIIHNP